MSAVGAWLARSRKAITAEVVGVIGWVQTAYVPDGHVDRAEWVGLAIVVAAGFGVYAVTNDPPGEIPAPPAAPDKPGLY
jgi:hypothetical protein